MATKKKLLQAAAGTAAAGGAGGLNVEEVFSTYVFTGNNSTQTITNGIDLSGEGGLVWTKSRGAAEHPNLYDTERGVYKILRTTLTNAESTNTNSLTAFNTDGFTLGTGDNANYGTYDAVSWTFRKAPKFFDVVTYTGDGTAGREIAHNLGCDVGAIFIKPTNQSYAWSVFHRSTGETGFLVLNSTVAVETDSRWWNNTAPTSSVFTLGDRYFVNNSGDTYVAYLFAHNDGDGDFGPTGDQDIIKCGSYTGNGSSTGPEIDLGFEPQWVLVKCATQGGSSPAYEWYLMDTMRGMTGESDTWITVNSSVAESTATYSYVKPEPTGFKIQSGQSRVNASGETYIYIAIRRGPMAVPTDATDVFDVELANATTTNGVEFQTGWPVDFAWFKDRDTGTEPFTLLSRLQGDGNYMYSSSTAAEAFGVSSGTFDHSDGWYSSTLPSDYYSCMWKRAPNFFDVVAYTGNGTAGRTVSHNLGVAPEMMWVKRRDTSAADWAVYHSALGNTKQLVLNTTAAEGTVAYWNNTTPTETNFTLGAAARVNNSGSNFIAYLFASLDGVSKVGSFTNVNGQTTNVDCGFSSGARFVIIKRYSSAEEWMVFDTTRGIVAGDDARLQLNSTAAENNGDYIDPYSSGFSTGADLNSGDYIFYAIA